MTLAVPQEHRVERRKPGLNKARAFLRHRVAQARLSTSRALPSIRAMALQADVSKATMSCAVREMSLSKLVCTRCGSGITVCSDTRPDAPVATTASPEHSCEHSVKWERLAQTMATDLANGIFDQRLPPIKALVGRYGVSYPTIRKAVRRLSAERIIVADRVGFRVLPHEVRPGASVILVARGEEDGRVMLWTKRTLESLRAVEHECSAKGLELVTLPWMMASGRVQYLRPGPAVIGEVARQRSAIGILLWITGIRDDLQSDVAAECAATGLPVAVLDEFGSPISPGPSMRVFDMAHGGMAGADVGRYLVGKGHRRIAFISPFHDQAWSPARYNGLRNACAMAGATTVPVTAELHGALFGDRIHRVSMERSIAERISSLTDDHPGTDALKRVVGALAAPIGEFFDREALQQALSPLFDTAASDANITAWVGANDIVALSAWEHLTQRGRKVPADIAVCGFDDNDDASLRGLTSYNFNNAAVVHAMMAHVLSSPRKSGVPRMRTRTEFAGFVVERSSTRFSRQR